MSTSRKVTDDNRGNVWNQQTLGNYFTNVNPGLTTFAWNQYTYTWQSSTWSLLGIINFNETTLLLTPTNINYELSALCINGTASNGYPYTYDTFVGAADFGTYPAKMIGDWYPLHVEMPPSNPTWNISNGSIGQLLSNIGSQLFIQWDVTSASTADQNICINRANVFNLAISEPATLIKNPGLALQYMIPDQLRDFISMISVLIDFVLVGAIMWLLIKVMGAWLELRKYLYQRKYFLVITPAVRYIAWALGSLIAFKVILEQELAFKTAMIFAALHTLLGVGTSNILELAVTAVASVVLGFLPAYFYKVALILATLMIGITMLILLYDAYFVYLKPLAYPKYKQ
jgi:hypothetical protein